MTFGGGRAALRQGMKDTLRKDGSVFWGRCFSGMEKVVVCAQQA